MPVKPLKDRNETTKTVDFLPVYSITGDIRKVSENDFANYNTKIFPIVSILQIEKGSNQLYPDMGALELVQSIKYSEISEAQRIVQDIVAHINYYTGLNVTGELIIPESNESVENKTVEMRLNIPGIPAPIDVQYDKKDNGIIKIRHPSMFK